MNLWFFAICNFTPSRIFQHVNLLDCFCWYFTGPSSAMSIPQISAENGRNNSSPAVCMPIPCELPVFLGLEPATVKISLEKWPKTSKTLGFLVWNRQFYCPLLEGDAFKKDQPWTNFWDPGTWLVHVGSPLQKNHSSGLEAEGPNRGSETKQEFLEAKNPEIFMNSSGWCFFPILWTFPKTVYTPAPSKECQLNPKGW